MKNVLISGGSRGIGAAMVRAFSAAGYSVGFTYKSSETEAMAIANECGALAICADSASPEAIIEALRCFRDKIGGVDILINNAAVSSIKPLSDVSLTEWEEIFSVGVTAAFLYTKGAMPDMIGKKAGRIINISSMWGLVGASCEVPYSAAKGAINSFTKALAKELGPSGITVNAIAPGLIATEMNMSLDEATIDTLCEETPLGRQGRPEEVADAALYLASDKAGFISGEILNISGGFVV